MCNNKFSYIHVVNGLLLFTLFIFACKGYAEGTKELQPTPPTNQNSTRLQIGTDKVYNFATYSSTPDKRLYIHIDDPATEKIYFGFGSHYHDGGDTTTLYYRIKDPNGNIVVPGTKVPVQGKGFIQNYQQAVIGPVGLNGDFGGYDPVVYQPTVAGDYYIEFSTDNTAKNNDVASNRVIFDNFDITVGKNLDKQTGRLWAYTWSLYSCGFDVKSYSKFFVYTTDSVVTRLDLNGMRPCGFGVMANQMGTTASTDFSISRESTTGDKSYSQYKIFLNDPDHVAYPGYTTDVRLRDSLELNGCYNTGYCIRINTTKAATGSVLIDFNQNGKQDPEDVNINLDLAAGDTCVPWDGRNGKGNQVAFGTTGKIYLKLYKGLTNFPVFDPEHNDNGFKVDLWRDTTFPNGKPIKVYWDDSKIPNLPASPSPVNLTGCLYTQSASGGCHTWTKPEPAGAGDNNTINTWWYVFEFNDSTVFTINTPPKADAGKDLVLCNDRNAQIDIGPAAGQSGVTYLWQELAPVQTILTNQTSFKAHANLNNTTKDSVIYVVTAFKDGCSVTDTMDVKFDKKSKPKIIGKTTVCPNSTNVQYWVVDSNAVTKTWSVVSGKTFHIIGDTMTVDNWGTAATLPAYDSVKVVSDYGNTCPKDSAYLLVTINSVISTPKPLGDSVFCYGQTPTVNYIVPTSQNSVFTWFVDGTAVAGVTSNQINVQWTEPPLSHTISVYEKVVNTPIVCSDTSGLLNVKIKSKPVLIAVKDTAICSGKPLNLGATLNSQPVGTTYQWLPALNLSNNKIANAVFQYSSDKKDTLQYVVQVNEGGCLTEDSILVAINPVPQVTDISGIEACEDSSVTYTVKDTFATSRDWFVYDAADNSKTYNFTTQGATKNQIKVKWGKKDTNAIVKVVSSGLCGSDTAVMKVLVQKYEQYKPKGDSGLCFSGPETLPYTVRSNGGGQFHWKLDTQPPGIGVFASATNNDSIQITWSGIGSAQLYVVENGAEDSLCTVRPDTLYISITNKGSVDAGLDTTICAGGTATLTAIGGSTYQWTPGNYSTPSITVSPLVKTNYVVKLLDPCKAQDSVTVFVNPIPKNPIAQTLIKFCRDDLDSIPLRARAGYTSYDWTPGNEKDSVIFIDKSTVAADEVTYFVTVEDAFGCQGSDSIVLKSECPPLLFVPRAFSPNGDNVNDQLEIFGRHFKNFEMRIFNRWGEVIYLTHDRNMPWNGFYRGEVMPLGTYPWTVTYSSELDNDPENPRQLKGSVTLVR